MTVHRICEDGQTLEIVRVVPEGTLRTIVRWDHPPTDEEVTTALRANSALEIALLTEQLGDGETKVRSRRQLTKRGAWYLTVQSGPPIWRYPRVDFLRWGVGVGWWLWAGVAWQDAPRPDGVNDARLRRADVTVR